MPQPDLRDVRDALAALTDAELPALMDAANGVPQVAPGLLAWLEAVCDWELNRRAGRDYPQPPEAAIPPEEDAASVDAVLAMRTTFFVKDSPTVRAFFDALVELLTGAGRRH